RGGPPPLTLSRRAAQRRLARRPGRGGTGHARKRDSKGPMGWIDKEPGWSALRAELKVVRRRMRQRWLLTAIWALLVTAAVVGWKARQNPSYRGSIVIRLVEDGFDEDTRPPTSRDITQYLYDIALSRPTLLSVIDEHGLYPEQRFDPTWAIESM